MSWLAIVYRVLFLFHFNLCESGKINSSPDGTNIIIKPGGSGKIIWKFDDDISTVTFRGWTFTSTDGLRSDTLGRISLNADPVMQPGILPGISIIKPAALVLNNVNQSYDGTYTFTLTTPAGTFISNVRVFIANGPKNTSIKLNPNPAPLGESFTITCSSRGFPEPSYKISHNGSHLINTTESHTISNVEWSHAGVYECSAENGVGPTDKASGTLNVTDTLNGSSDEGRVVVWHIVVSLLSGIIIGILFSYIVLCSHRRWCRNRKPERNSERQTDGVDTTYEEFDLTKMNTEYNYQSLRRDAAASASNDVENDDEQSTYTQLSKTRDEEDNYESLT